MGCHSIPLCRLSLCLTCFTEYRDDGLFFCKFYTCTTASKTRPPVAANERAPMFIKEEQIHGMTVVQFFFIFATWCECVLRQSQVTGNSWRSSHPPHSLLTSYPVTDFYVEWHIKSPSLWLRATSTGPVQKGPLSSNMLPSRQ